ncbi:Prenylcysteine lyase-domain-containing protein [Rhodotorula diobovata]|uniref:Prenylcysteine lyase-domain-containing protein n=1 Tax=Rhodotorula diobovata TaxID=5288 RepID=A0A5C5G6A2_9BASI|nr:Prenylcysteine lyase-domain-containing protein [Rhodotorula diobovata]
MRALSTLVLLALIAHTSAQLLWPVNQLPFRLAGNGTTAGGPGVHWKEKRAPRIAVIGAGAGGSSAAYFLSHFGKLKDLGLETDVTIYEQADHVGGRSTVVWPWNDDPLSDPRPLGADKNDTLYEPPVEMGASVFVAANKNLVKAVSAFGLELDAYGGEEGQTAAWDGERWVYQEKGSFGWGWWSKIKAVWRYGRSPFTARSLVKSTVDSFLRLYSPDFVSQGAFDSLANFSAATNLAAPASHYADEYLTHEGVGELFTRELISAASQVNYGTPITRIHGVGALVSLAATGATSVRGGNRRIFEEFIGRSGARLRLGETARVQSVLKLDGTKDRRAQWLVKTVSGVGGGTYDAVVLAAPFHQTGIELVNTPAPALIPKQAYVRLFVTFVITNASTPQPSYFDLPPDTRMPNEIFGTFTTPSRHKPTFNSLNYLKALPASIGARFGEGTFHVVKMFSSRSLEPEMLDTLYGAGNVAKVVEKVWFAYPQLAPVRSEDDFAPVRPDEGLYYVNAFERLISTMETETVSAFNVVSLLLNDFFGYTPPTSWAEWDDGDA